MNAELIIFAVGGLLGFLAILLRSQLVSFIKLMTITHLINFGSLGWDTVTKEDREIDGLIKSRGPFEGYGPVVCWTHESDYPAADTDVATLGWF